MKTEDWSMTEVYKIMTKMTKECSFTYDHTMQWAHSEVIGQGSLKQKVLFHRLHNLIAYLVSIAVEANNIN